MTTLAGAEIAEGLVIAPGEVLVLRAARALSMDEFERITEVIRECTPADMQGRILIVDANFEIAKVSP